MALRAGRLLSAFSSQAQLARAGAVAQNATALTTLPTGFESLVGTSPVAKPSSLWPAASHGLPPPRFWSSNSGNAGGPATEKPSQAAAPSTGAGGQADKKQDDAPPLSQDVHYVGPLGKTHKLLKMISVSNTAIAFAAAPMIVAWADVSTLSRYGLASSLVAFGLITTGALHWLTHPYVHELKYTAATQTIECKTVSLFGNKKTHTFQLDEVTPLPWDRPVASFAARGHFYYIDVFSFPDEHLLKRLVPQAPEGYKDDEDA